LLILPLLEEREKSPRQHQGQSIHLKWGFALPLLENREKWGTPGHLARTMPRPGHSFSQFRTEYGTGGRPCPDQPHPSTLLASARHTMYLRGAIMREG